MNTISIPIVVMFRKWLWVGAALMAASAASSVSLASGSGFSPTSQNVEWGTVPAIGTTQPKSATFVVSGTFNPLPQNLEFVVSLTGGVPATFPGTISDALGYVSISQSAWTITTDDQGDDFHSKSVTVTVNMPYLPLLPGSVAPTLVYQISTANLGGANASCSLNATVTPPPVGAIHTAPVVTIVTPVNGSTISYLASETQPIITLNFHANGTLVDPISSLDAAIISATSPTGQPISLPIIFVLSTSGEGTPAATGTAILPTLAPGTYTILCRGFNEAGLFDAETTTFTVSVTALPPDLVITEPSAPNYYYNVASGTAAHVPVNFTATAGAGTTLTGWSGNITRPDGTIASLTISPITPSGTSATGTTPLDLTVAGLYTLSYTAWNNLGGTVTKTRSFTVVITKATPILTWPNPVTINYGTVLSNLQLNAAATVNGLSVPGGGIYTYTTSLGAPIAVGTLLNAGTYTLHVTFTPTNSTLYNSISTTVPLLVNKVPLTVRAEDKTKVYGEANPALTSVITGFVNGETFLTSGVSGGPALATVTAASGVAPDHPITAAIGTLAAGNYTFDFVNGKLAITPATLTVSAGAATKVYGDPLPAFSSGVSGFKNGDTALNAYTGVPSYSTAANAGSIPGDYGVSPTMGTLLSSNYNFTFVANILTVTKAELTFRALNDTRVYGAGNPAFGFEVLGYRNGDNASSAYTGSPVLSTTAVANSGVSQTYPINIGPGAGATALTSAKYTFAFVPAQLTITRATLEVRANNASIVIGDALPTFTAAITGFVAGDTQASAVGGVPALTLSTSTPGVGTHTIFANVGTLLAANYVFMYFHGTLTVSAPSVFTITGTVYFDLNKNAVLNSGEIGLPGIQVKLYNGTALAGTAVTNGLGVYSFTVSAGTYVVDAIEPAGMAPTDALPRQVTIVSANPPAQNFGLFFNFTALRGLNGDGNSHGYWKNNLSKALSSKTSGMQETVANLLSFSATIGNNLALPLFNGTTMSSAVAVMSAGDQLALQLLASEYNFVSGRLINGNVTLTYAFIYWGEHVHTNSTNATERTFVKNWMDAFNNSHGGVVAGPLP